MARLRCAMVCSSNQNRSMEAHALLKRHGFDVSSYGTGAHVKLPGPSLREPNVYDFGTPYKYMHDDLRRKDLDLYKRNGILPMLKRNLGVKNAPQRWQDNAADGLFDVVMAFEEKVFDIVIEDLNNREQRLTRSILVINLEVKDNHEEAAAGAKLALDLCQEVALHCLPDIIFNGGRLLWRRNRKVEFMVKNTFQSLNLLKIDAAGCWEDEIDDIVSRFERQHKRKVLYTISFY